MDTDQPSLLAQFPFISILCVCGDSSVVNYYLDNIWKRSSMGCSVPISKIEIHVKLFDRESGNERFVVSFDSFAYFPRQWPPRILGIWRSDVSNMAVHRRLILHSFNLGTGDNCRRPLHGNCLPSVVLWETVTTQSTYLHHHGMVLLHNRVYCSFHWLEGDDSKPLQVQYRNEKIWVRFVWNGGICCVLGNGVFCYTRGLDAVFVLQNFYHSSQTNEDYAT